MLLTLHNRLQIPRLGEDCWTAAPSTYHQCRPLTSGPLLDQVPFWRTAYCTLAAAHDCDHCWQLL